MPTIQTRPDVVHPHWPNPEPWPGDRAAPRATPVPGALRPGDHRHQSSGGDAAFLALQAGYRGHGGIARGESLADCLAHAGLGGYVELARRLVTGQLFSFQWDDTFWVPMFQFDATTHALRAAPRQVLDELHGVLDGWDLAHWHVRPHEGLRGQRPIDLLDADLPAVLAAARADRFALNG